MTSVLTHRPAFLIAIIAGSLASGVAFMSSAGAENGRAAGAPIRVATAVFAGGDFGYVEADFDRIDGVVDTLTGYTGGTVERPGYRQVTSGSTGHYEAVKVTYDPAIISYDQLAAQFLRAIDPTDAEGQVCDRGDYVRAAFFVSGATERNAAVAAVSSAQRAIGEEVVTEILPLGTFWPAEEQYQNYAQRSPARYASERRDCGRDARIAEIWGTASTLTN